MTIVESLEVQRASRRFISTSMRAPLLSRADELALAVRWRETGDIEALHGLIDAYTRLVVRPAMQYRRYGASLSDLVQEGVVGLLIAAQRFQPERQPRFSTYAAWWVRSAMQEYILRNWSIVRTGTTAAQKSLFFNFRRLRARIDEPHDRRLTAEARRHIADELKVPIGDVEAMENRLSANDQSLNAPAGLDGEEEWQDHLADPAPSPEARAVSRLDGETRSRWLAAVLDELTVRERRIIDARRLGDDAVTLKALSRRLGISKERVRQIEHGAMGKIKRSIIRQSGIKGGRPLFDA